MVSRWSGSLVRQQPITGRMIKEDGSAVNVADLLADGGGDDDIASETAAEIFSYGNGVTLRTVSDSGLPLLSIRAKTSGSIVVPLDVSIFSGGNAYFEIYINPSLTGASWASAGSSSATEYDISATAISGGTRVASGFVVMSGGITEVVGRENLLGRLGLEFDTTTNIGDIMTIFITPFAGNVSASSCIQWRKV